MVGDWFSHRVIGSPNEQLWMHLPSPGPPKWQLPIVAKQHSKMENQGSISSAGSVSQVMKTYHGNIWKFHGYPAMGKFMVPLCWNFWAPTSKLCTLAAGPLSSYSRFGHLVL